MVLIFLKYLSFLPFQVFSFEEVKLLWLHRQGWVAPVHVISIHWIITFGGNAGVFLSQAAAKARNSSWV